MSKKLPHIGAALALFLTTPAFADPVPASIEKWLKPQQPQSVILDAGRLSVTLPRATVTREQFDHIMANAVCMSLVDQPASWGKAKINQVEVIDQTGRQGYVFDGGAKECSSMGAMTTEQFKQKVLDPKTRRR